MSRAATPGTTRPARQQEALDFEAERDAETASWERAEPKAASIQRLGRYGFVVELPDGDDHILAVGSDDGQHVGWCRCKGFEYNEGPCAHLCTIRKADWHCRNLGTDLLDDDGQPVEIAPTVEGRQPDTDPEPSTHTPDLDPLTDRQREVYLAVADRGLKPHQVADQEDIKATTARTHLWRARNRLDDEHRDAQQTGDVFKGGQHDAQ